MLSIKDAYEGLWRKKLTDPIWLAQDGKGRVEHCSSLLRNHGVNKNTIILDIGCGTGVLKKYLPEPQIHGIDISQTAIEEAIKVYESANAMNLDEEQLPFDDNKFDYVVCLDTIEHLFDPNHALEESYRALAKNGILIISTPNILNISSLRTLLMQKRFPKTSCDRELYDGGHMHFFTYRDVDSMLKDVGFKGVKAVGPLSGGFLHEFREDMVWVEAKKI